MKRKDRSLVENIDANPPSKDESFLTLTPEARDAMLQAARAGREAAEEDLPDEDDYCELSIPLQFMDEAFSIEDELAELGMTFDTGAGFGYRFWQMDYPLENGHTARDIISYVKEHYPRFYEMSSLSCWKREEDGERDN